MTSSNESDEENDNTPDPINYKNFRKYLKENGRERALGYLDAIKALNENIEALFYYYDTRYKREMANSPHRVRTNLVNFNVEMDLLLEKVQQSKLLSQPVEELKGPNS